MRKLLYILLLFTIADVTAQQLPERSLVRRGNRQYNKGNYEQAISRYEQALQSAAGQFEATYNLGNALYKAERFDRAEQTMQQAAADSLQSDNDRAEAFYNLGNAQFKQKKYKEALESYKQSLRRNPSDMEAKYNYAYTKRLLDEEKKGGGGNDQKKDQNKDQQDQNKDQQDQNKDQQQNQQPDKSDKNDKSEGEPQPSESKISPQEQQQMLDAIQAQEDKTQDKLKEKKGVVVRGKKNW